MPSKPERAEHAPVVHEPVEESAIEAHNVFRLELNESKETGQVELVERFIGTDQLSEEEFEQRARVRAVYGHSPNSAIATQAVQQIFIDLPLLRLAVKESTPSLKGETVDERTLTLLGELIRAGAYQPR